MKELLLVLVFLGILVLGVTQFLPDRTMTIQFEAGPNGYQADEALPALIKNAKLYVNVRFSANPSATLTLTTEDGKQLSIALRDLKLSIEANFDVTGWFKDFAGKKVHFGLAFDKSTEVVGSPYLEIRYSPLNWPQLNPTIDIPTAA